MTGQPRPSLFPILPIFALGLLLGSIPLAPALQAQTIQGRVVIDEDRTPVPLAIVILLGPDSSVVTQTLSRDDGSFTLSPPSDGFYALRVTGMGIGDHRTSVFGVGEDETLDFEIRVPAKPIELEELVVVAMGDRGRDRFRRRMEQGEGFFLDQEALEEIDPVDYIDIFRAVEGVFADWAFVRQEDGSLRPTPRVRAGPQSCMTYMLDDRPIRAGIGDNRTPLALFPLSGLPMESIQAVEVYRDLSEVPAELRNSAFRPVWGEHGSYHELTCGITVFRTRARW
jgi:hypothetical protein